MPTTTTATNSMSAGAMVGPPKPHHDCLRRLFNPLMSTSENGSARWSFALCQSGSRPGARAMRPSRGNRWRRRGGHLKDPKDPKWRSPQNGPCARQSPPLGNATMIGSIEEWGSEGLARLASGDHHYRRRDWADGQRGRVCCATNQTSTLGQQFWDDTPLSSCSTTQFSLSLSHSHRMPHASGRTPTNALRQPGIGHDGHPLDRCWEMLAWCHGWWRRPRETGNERDMDWSGGTGLEILDMGCPPPMPNTQAQRI